MKPAEYPEKTCREGVAGEHNNYWCELPLNHPGPCASFSSAISVKARDVYEQANPEWREKMTSADIIL
jgi:hypothetical protein